MTSRPSTAELIDFDSTGSEGLRPTDPTYPRLTGRLRHLPPTSPRNRRSTDHTWLTADEAALYLGLRSRMALYQAVRRGQIPVHHLGRRLRFRRSELDALLSNR